MSHCTYLVHEPLTPWSSVSEKLIVTQLLSKFIAVYGTRRFITVLT